MNDFEFYNPVKIFFGRDQILKIASQIPSSANIMLLYGGGSIFRNGVYDNVINALKNFKITEFGGIEPNPTYETSMKAVEIIKEKKIDYLLAAGGGSVVDATKFIAAAALYENGDPWKILSKSDPVTASIPFGVILTLPATGTEMNKNSVISRKSTVEKFAFSSPYSFPQFSVLTPEAAGTLPRNQVANGTVDAFVHVIEQYLTYPVNAPIQDRFAEAILITLIEEGPKAYANPADYDAMANLMWSATMALNGLIMCGVPGDWSVHSIGHELTALHGIDHARTLAIVLPGLWKVLRVEKGKKLIQYGERVWNITEGTDEERIDAAISKTAEFFESLGIKTHLSDYGVKKDTIEKIVKRFEERKWLELGDRGLTTPEATRKALEYQL
ncbi:MAG: iron-containing alcohol dehydrogenase [Bacteroidales bacterium]|nr:iron-containing alcohol dehydrogenase [Bacteroidales bacterium]MBK8882569.1 iron-containing alcohol dehydrogenase [Bacteroidales bacterium]